MTAAKDKEKETGTQVEAGANKETIIDRSGEVTLNQTDREKQIAEADAEMKRKSDAKAPGAKALKTAHDEEEEKYAGHKDLPPPTGKAFNTNTPKAINPDGTKVW